MEVQERLRRAAKAAPLRGHGSMAAAVTVPVPVVGGGARPRPRSLPVLPSLPPLASPLWWTVGVVAIVTTLALPLLVIAGGLLRPASETWSHVAATVLSSYAVNSAYLVAGAGLLTLVLGVTTAWLVSAYDFAGRRVFTWALILPLAVPAYIAAYTYAGMLDVTGPVQKAVRWAVPGLADEFLYMQVTGLGAAVLIFSFVLYPYVYLVARTSFSRQSAGALEAARLLGRGPFASFFRVALPLARPALAAGVGLVAMEVLNDYGAVRYLGVTTFTTGIFRSWFGLGDLDSAVRLSALLMLFVFGLLALERAQRGRASFSGIESQRPVARRQLRGPAAAAAILICAVPLAFGFLIPVAQLATWSATTAGSVIDASFLRLVANSFMLAAAAAVVCVTLGLFITFAVRLHPGRWLQRFSRIAVLGYSIPGAVIAVGVLVPFAWIDHRVGGVMGSVFGVPTGLLLSGTLAALMFAYAVRFMAVALLPLESGFSRVCRNVDSAARCLGASPVRALRCIALPLLRGTMAGAVILVFVDVMKELPLTLILRPFNFDTLATRAYQLATDELLAVSANYSLVIIAAGIIPVIVLNRLLERRT
jgi:iron(III) transport system permease protein